jgi:hypothetical protein
MLEALGGLCGIAVTTVGAGTYSYYERPGDFLALHRDVLTCDVAVITCLANTGLENASLMVYPNSLHKPLSQVRAEGRSSGTPVPLAPGDTAIALGGVLPHEVTPMQGAGERLVSIMCYRIPELAEQ